jgi:hypothetical protein
MLAAAGSSESFGELRSIVVGPEMHKEHSRLLVEQVAANGGNLYPARRLRMSALTSSPVTTKAPVTAAFPSPVG